jgi:hypothetical protein
VSGFFVPTIEAQRYRRFAISSVDRRLLPFPILAIFWSVLQMPVEFSAEAIF